MQVIVLVAEVVLLTAAWWLPGSDIAITACALLIDLLMISPLKAGRAFFFETLTADGDAARLSLLFRYYRHGYERTVYWRLLLWASRLLWSSLLCLPAFFLFAYSGVLSEGTPSLQDRVLSMALFGFGLLLLVTAFIAIEIILFRLVPVPYLLSHPGGLRGALSLSRRMMRGRVSTLTLLYLDHAGWLLSCLLLFPYVFTSALFQTARAATIRQFLRQIPPENAPHLLQRRKKYGRMGR